MNRIHSTYRIPQAIYIMYMCVYTYVYIYIYMYMYICMYIYVCVYICICICVCVYICIYLRIPVRKKKERSRKLIQRNNSWEIPKSREENGHLDHEAYEFPNRWSSKRSTPRHVMTKLPRFKDKEKFFKIEKSDLSPRKTL